MKSERTHEAQALPGSCRCVQARGHVSVVLRQRSHEVCRRCNIPQWLRHQAVHGHVLQLYHHPCLPAAHEQRLHVQASERQQACGRPMQQACILDLQLKSLSPRLVPKAVHNLCTGISLGWHHW